MTTVRYATKNEVKASLNTAVNAWASDVAMSDHTPSFKEEAVMQAGRVHTFLYPKPRAKKAEVAAAIAPAAEPEQPAEAAIN